MVLFSDPLTSLPSCGVLMPHCRSFEKRKARTQRAISLGFAPSCTLGAALPPLPSSSVSDAIDVIQKSGFRDDAINYAPKPRWSETLDDGIDFSVPPVCAASAASRSPPVWLIDTGISTPVLLHPPFPPPHRRLSTWTFSVWIVSKSSWLLL